METKSQALIRQLKDIKQRKKISYNEIMDALPTENGVPAISKTTLQRVFAEDSETRASRFNYEETLLPIAEAINRIDGGSDDILQSDIILLLKEQISEKDALISRLIDRLDQKDEIIRQFLTDMKQKDQIIHNLMEKYI